MSGKLGCCSGQEIRVDAKAKITTFIGIGGGGGVRLAWLCEDDGAWRDDVSLVAAGEIPGAAQLKGYFDFLVEVTRANVRGGWTGDNFERAKVREALDFHVSG